MRVAVYWLDGESPRLDTFENTVHNEVVPGALAGELAGMLANRYPDVDDIVVLCIFQLEQSVPRTIIYNADVGANVFNYGRY
jgi:hypothetical protein